MALKATIETNFGEKRELYIRLNNFDTLSKHAPSSARFRGFLSKEAFDAGKSFVWEDIVEFTADLSDSAEGVARQAYKALCEQRPELSNAVSL